MSITYLVSTAYLLTFWGLGLDHKNLQFFDDSDDDYESMTIEKLKVGRS